MRDQRNQEISNHSNNQNMNQEQMKLLDLEELRQCLFPVESWALLLGEEIGREHIAYDPGQHPHEWKEVPQIAPMMKNKFMVPNSKTFYQYTGLGMDSDFIYVPKRNISLITTCSPAKNSTSIAIINRFLIIRQWNNNSSTIARWLKSLLQAALIPVFNAHSVMGASSSVAENLGITTNEAADLISEYVFYYKPIGGSFIWESGTLVLYQSEVIVGWSPNNIMLHSGCKL